MSAAPRLAPDLRATARVVRGEYDFAGKRFEFDDNGTVTCPPSWTASAWT
jgi:autotransporter translocation and assembly factor TamB